MASIKDLEPGKYTARIKDWGIKAVESLNGEKVFIQMEISHSGVWYSGSFECFTKTKAGEPNQKLVRTLKACGFTGNTGADLSQPTALNMEKDFDVTVIEENGYKKIEWINDPNEAPAGMAKMTDVKKLQGMDLGMGNPKGKTPGKPQVKNFAPQTQDDASDIPF